MIIVDRLLEQREREGRPIRVGLIGAGFMAQGLANTIANSVQGMNVAAIYGRRLDRAAGVYEYAGLGDAQAVTTQDELEDAIRAERPVITDDPQLLCHSEQIDALVELTGSVEFGAQVTLEAFRHGKHVILMNAELDATIGPLLHVYARNHGVILSACDGDEPGVQMNLVRWVRGLGLVPRVIGNVKGLQDPYRNPDTQRDFAEKWGQNPAMVTSFADGSKISFEQAIAANATGFSVLGRGMSRGVPFDGSPLELPSLYDVEEVRALGGIVDYTVGPSSVKVFCLAEHSDPKQRHYLELYKLGDGPLYPFWIPYHLPHVRGAERDRARRLARRRPRPAARRPVGGGLRGGEARPGGRRDAGRLRHVHDLRGGGERRRDERSALPARGPGRGLPPAPRHRPGRAAQLRRRRVALGSGRRPAASGAVQPLPRRVVARGTAAGRGLTGFRRASDQLGYGPQGVSLDGAVARGRKRSDLQSVYW